MKLKVILPLQQGWEIWTDFSQNPRKETNVFK